MKQLKIRSLIVLAGLIIPAVGLAQDAPELNGANTAWVLVSTALVLFMTLPGLALFYSGLVRSKNVLSRAHAVLQHRLPHVHPVAGAGLRSGIR